MRCLSCDKVLRTSSELGRRYEESKKFIDLCDGCFGTIKDVVRVAKQIPQSKPEEYHEDEM